MNSVSKKSFVSPQAGGPLDMIEEETMEEKSQEVKRKRKNKKERKFRKLNPFRDLKPKSTIDDQAVPSETDEAVDSNRLESLSPQQLEKEAVNMYKLGMASGGSSSKAIAYLKRSLEIRQKLGQNSPEEAVIYEQLGDLFVESNQDDEALFQYKLCLRLFRQIENREDYKDPETRENLLEMRRRVTDNLIETENRVEENKEKSLKWDNKELNDFSKREHVEVYREVAKLGDFEGEIGHFENAIKYYKNAIILLRKQLDADHEYVLGAQTKLADTFLRNGEILRAINLHASIAEFLEVKRQENVYFLKVMILNTLGDESNEKFAPIFKVENMGDKFLETGTDDSDFEQAVIFYRKALSSLLELEGLNPGSKHILRVYVKLGTVSWMADESGDMFKSYTNALVYFEGKGDELKDKKDYKNASQCYTQALRFLLKINNHKHKSVQKIVVKLADVCLISGKSQAALELYEIIMKDSEDDNPAYLQKILKNLVLAHEAIGDDNLMKKDNKGALIHFQEVLNVSRSKIWNEKKTSSNFIKEARCLQKIGEAHFTNENFGDAKDSYLSSLKILTSNSIERGNLKKVDVASIAHTHHKLGSIYYFSNEYGEAENHFERAIAIKGKIYDPLDKTLFMSKLALCLSYQKSDKIKALQYYSNLFNDFEGVGPDVLRAMGREYLVTSHQLAKLRAEQGDLDDAFKVHATVLEHLQSWPQKDPVLIFNTLSDMGETLATKGDFKTAIKFFEMAIDESNNILSHHKETLNEKIYVRLAYCYSAIDETEKSLEFYSKALHDDAYSIENHLIYNNIGTQLAKIERYEEALKFFHSSILFLKEGKHNDIVMMAFNNIGNVYYKIQDEDKAIEYYTSALEKSKSKEIELPSFTLYNLGNLYLSKGEMDKAKKYFKEFLLSVDANVGKGHHNRENTVMKANGLNNIGNIECGEKKYEEAVWNYSEALKLKIEIFGNECEEICGTLCNLGSAYNQIENYESAYNHYKTAYEISTKKQLDTSRAIKILNALGRISMSMKNYDRALVSYRELLRLEKETSNDNEDTNLLLCEYKVGLVLSRKDEHKEAVAVFEEVYEKMKAILGETHLETIKVLLSTAQGYLNQQKLAEAKSSCMEAMKALEKGGHGSNHTYYKRAKKLLSKILSTFLA